MNQGLIHFPGIAAMLNASFTLTPGVTPSVCTMRIAPQPAWSPKVGTLSIQYGGFSVKFQDCTIDRIQSTIDGSGHLVWDVSILDRRWMWKGNGRISGYYNVRRETGIGQPLEIVKGTEKSPKELAKLCLEALGESAYNVDEIPNDPRPEIEWDYVTPAQALAQLCDDLECQVVLTLGDKIRIVRRNEGAKLPQGNTFLSGGSEIDPPEQPDEIVIVTAPRVYQTDLELEYIGLDLDHKVKLIDDLSYTPKKEGSSDKTWVDADVEKMLCVENPAARKLAVQSVYRWARVKVPFTGHGDETIKDLDRVLPLLNYQVQERKIYDAKGNYRTEPREPIVYGRFYQKASGTKDVRLPGETYLDDVPPPHRKYTDGFSVDVQTGIVKFSQPVYRLGEDGEGGLDHKGIFPAKLWLRTCFNLRDQETRGWLRREYPKKLPGGKNGTKPAYFRHDDLQPKWWKLKDWQNNLDDVDKQATYYTKEHLRMYQTQNPQSGVYAGFLPLEPDGMITSVTWWISDEGFAMTRAMRGKEETGDFASYAERRLWEKQAEERRQAAKTALEQARRQRRSRA